MKDSIDFGSMEIPKLFRKLLIPTVLGMVFSAVFVITDGIFMGRGIGSDALAAVNITAPLFLVSTGVGLMFGVGASVVASIHLAQGKVKAARINVTQAVAVSSLLLAAYSFLITSCAREVALLLGSSERLLPLAVEYMHWFAPFLPFSALLSSGMFFIRLDGSPNYAMLCNAVPAVINIVLDPILIFGWFGLPRMEVAGAAIATVAGQIVAAAAALVLNLKCNPDIHILPREIRWHGKVAAEIYRVGFPSIVMQSIGSAMVFGMNKILLSFTKTATAVFGAYFKLQSFVFMPVFGLNNGMVPIVSYNYGAASLPRVKRTIKLTICTAMAIMAVGCLIFQLFPQQLLMFFNASEEMLSIGSVALRIISVSFVLAGFDIIAGSVCQAIGNPLYSLITSVCRQLVVLLPVAWLLSHTGVLTLVWLAFPISELVSLVLSAIFLRRTMRAVAERIGSRAA